MDEKIDPLQLRLARDYARLSYEDPSHPLLELVHVSPKIRQEMQKTFIEGKKPTTPILVSLAFDFEKYARGIDYFGEDNEGSLEDLEQEDFRELISLYSEEVETEWNRIIYDRRITSLAPFVTSLRTLNPSHPYLLAALFDINGEPRGFDYKRTSDLFELRAKERRELLEKEGIEDYSYLLVNYINVLAEEVYNINERNKSDLVSILRNFEQKKKSSGQQ